MMKKMLVVARKYNDIFYAFSTQEWQECDIHILIMLTGRLDSAQYPLQSEFDKVYTIHTRKGRFDILRQIWHIRSVLLHLEWDIVTLSNIAIVSHLFILNNAKTRRTVLLEDGLMNYYDFTPSRNARKLLLMRALGIDEKKIEGKISRTYLLSPENAVYYKGTPVKLSVRSEEICSKMNIGRGMAGESVFVGCPVYKTRNISVKEYSALVNRIIRRFKIDYYLPHSMSSEDETVDCEILDITKDRVSIEIYTHLFPLKLYSFYSSTLYTAKLLNPQSETYAVVSDKVGPVSPDSIICKQVDGIIKV